MKSFTIPQQRAIDLRGCDLLVAAAAGSGKTAVLVERIIKTVTDIENPIDIDRLLVVTFTEAAASEMRQRILGALTGLLEETPESEHLKRQVALLDKAQITTIHSFCLSVIRRNFHLIDLDPRFKISDETETKLLVTETLEELFEDEFQKEENEEFLNLVEYFTNKTNEDYLEKLILQVYYFISGNPWPDKWIDRFVELFNLEEGPSLDETEWAKLIKEELRVVLEGVNENIGEAIKICNRPMGPEKYLVRLQEDAAIAAHLLKNVDNTLENFYKILSDFKFGSLYPYRSNADIDEELKNRVKNIRDKEIKEAINDIKSNYFFKPIDDMRRDAACLYPIMKELGRVVKLFSVSYSNAKRERNLADFNDLEHYCLEILLGEGSTEEESVPTRAALELKDKYVEILIDEYQDSNLIQELILKAVSNEEIPNRFMVGDIKQAIYKFRNASPELFMEKYDSFSYIDGSPSIKIDLYQNFRSRKSVLDAVNFFFYQLMTKRVGEIVYDENAALYCGAQFPEAGDLNISSTTEVHVIENNKGKSDYEYEDSDQLNTELDDISSIELEAKYIALRINEMINSDHKLFVLDDGTKSYRPCEYRDIVILMRAVNSVSEVFISELKKLGIPCSANSNTGFFDSIEVNTMISLLQIIDNPLQDYNIIAVLFSPIYSFTADELVEIRCADKNNHFYQCIKTYINENDTEIANGLRRFLTDLEKWRDLAVYSPISQLISALYDDTDYVNYCGVMPQGAVRQANLRYLVEKSIQYEKTSYKGLFHFIKYIERIKKSGVDTGSAALLENDNIVKMMTIHKSKGLEFPVVFVSRLGKLFNLSDNREKIILHQKLGFGPVYIDLENRVKSNTIARNALAIKTKSESLSEELRVLYVALTRAKEKLILTGCINDYQKNMEKWSRFVSYEKKELPPYYMLKSKNPMDWIMPAVLRHEKANHLVNVNGVHDELFNFTADFEIFISQKESLISNEKELEEIDRNMIKKLAKISVTDTINMERKTIFDKMNWIYPYNSTKDLPTKISITELKRIYFNERFQSPHEHPDLEAAQPAAYTIMQSPEFLKEAGGVTPAEKGTAIHAVMEHLDIKKDSDAASIESLIHDLIERSILTEEQGASIEISKILKFLNTGVGKRMRNSAYIKKEAPFVMGLEPNEIYPDEPYSQEAHMNHTILVHGIIDCFFMEEDEIVLVDYKSDAVSKGEINALKERYKVQLMLYKKAIERSTGKRVKESIIYLFSLGKEVNLY